MVMLSSWKAVSILQEISYLVNEQGELHLLVFLLLDLEIMAEVMGVEVMLQRLQDKM